MLFCAAPGFDLVYRYRTIENRSAACGGERRSGHGANPVGRTISEADHDLIVQAKPLKETVVGGVVIDVATIRLVSLLLLIACSNIPRYCWPEPRIASMKFQSVFRWGRRGRPS